MKEMAIAGVQHLPTLSQTVLYVSEDFSLTERPFLDECFLEIKRYFSNANDVQ